MARPVVITKSLATAASATAVALSQSPLAAGNLTLNGAAVVVGVAVFLSQRRVIVTSGGDDTGATFVIIGTNDNGSEIKDSFAGANGAAAQSNIDFLTVTSIRISKASASTVTAGTNGVGSCPWQRYDPHLTPGYISLNAQLLSGSASINVEYTYDEFLPASQGNAAILYAANTPNPQVLLHPQLQGIAASAEGALNFPFSGWRFTILSGTGTWKVTGTQAGLAGP